MKIEGATMIVTGSSQWQGTFREGDGTITTATGTLTDAPYTYASRFEGAPGACPEELLGAAHAACFNHALANISGIHGFTTESVTTSADVTMRRDDQGPAILAIHLNVQAKVPGATNETFQDLATRAKVNCAFSKVLTAALTMDATLVH